MCKDSLLTKLRYSFYPVIVEPKNGISIRKRIFHKEFVILVLVEIDNVNYYEEIGKVNCIKEAVEFINDLYDIKINI